MMQAEQQYSESQAVLWNDQQSLSNTTRMHDEQQYAESRPMLWNDQDDFRDPYGEEIMMERAPDALDDKKRRGRQIGGAAAVGGIAGFMLVGPIIGIAAAGGAAALACNNKNKAGAVARGAGEVAACAGTGLARFERRTHLVRNTAKGVGKGCSWVVSKVSGGNKSNSN